MSDEVSDNQGVRARTLPDVGGLVRQAGEHARLLRISVAMLRDEEAYAVLKARSDVSPTPRTAGR